MALVKVVSSHAERVVTRVDDVFVKVETDHDIAVLTIGHPERLPAVLDGYGASFDTDAVRAHWILRTLSVIHWRVAHDLPYEDDVLALRAL